MTSNILSAILVGDSKKKLESLNTTLGKIYKLQVDKERRDTKRQAEEKQAEKRKEKEENFLKKILEEIKGFKKGEGKEGKKKGLFDLIKEGLLKVFTEGFGAIKPLFKGLFKVGGPIFGVVTAALLGWNLGTWINNNIIEKHLKPKMEEFDKDTRNFADKITGGGETTLEDGSVIKSADVQKAIEQKFATSIDRDAGESGMEQARLDLEASKKIISNIREEVKLQKELAELKKTIEKTTDESEKVKLKEKELNLDQQILETKKEIAKDIKSRPGLDQELGITKPTPKPEAAGEKPQQVPGLPPITEPVPETTPLKRMMGGSIVPGTGTGDSFHTLLNPGDFVLNRRAAAFMRGGPVHTVLEPGEEVYSREFMEGPLGPEIAMLNDLIPRFFQGGGEVSKDKPATPTASKNPLAKSSSHPNLEKLNDKNIKKISAPPGYCVTGSLNTMQASGVPNPAATGLDDGNNPRGGAVQLIKSYGWKGIGGKDSTLKSPYGTVNTGIYSRGDYDSAVKGGKIPSGAIIFQTEHDDWNGTSYKSRGYDMAIAQKNGAALWNGQSNGQWIYGGGTKQVIALSPNGIAGKGGPIEGDATGGSSNIANGDQPQQTNPFDSFMGGLAGMGAIGTALGGMFKGISNAFGPENSWVLSSIFGGAGALMPGGAPAQAGQTQSEETRNTPGAAMAGGGLPGAYGIASKMGADKKQWDIYRNTLASIESAGSGGYSAAGGSGGQYDGRYQLGAKAKTDAARILGVPDPGHTEKARAAYRKNAEMQEQFLAGYTKANYGYMTGNKKFDAADTTRKLQYLGYAHNQGGGGANTWLNSGVVGADGFGTKGTKYTDALAKNFKAQGYQKGGVVGGGTIKRAPTDAFKRFENAQKNYADTATKKAGGNVVVVSGGGKSNSGPTIVPTPSTNANAPTLPNGPSSVQAAEYFFRLNMGSVC